MVKFFYNKRIPGTNLIEECWGNPENDKDRENNKYLARVAGYEVKRKRQVLKDDSFITGTCKRY